MKRLAGLLLLALVLAACGPSEGTVVEKVHFPDLSYWTVATTCNGTACSTSPHWVYVPECYRLKVRTPEDKLEDTCVDFSAYGRLNVGDYWREDKS